MDPQSQPPLAPPPDDTLREYYHLHFAGRPRVTRNTTLLRQLITLAGRNQNHTLATLWQTELQHIEAEQAQAGLAGRQMAQRIEEGQIVAHRLRMLQLDAARYGVDVASIDRRALAAAQQDAVRLAAAVAPPNDADPPHAERARAMARTLQSLVDESQNIDASAHAARTSGPALRRAQACVRAAQLLQHTFDTRVAELPGAIVRPERITLLAEGLHDVATLLAACELDGPEHAANCQALLQQASFWRSQAQKAASLRRQHTADEQAHMLAAAADDVLEAAHAWGQGAQADADVLAQGIALCDRMDEIRRQLEGVPLVFGLTEHHHTLSTVTDGLAYLTARLAHHTPL